MTFESLDDPATATERTCDIAIVGAGACGLTLARRLAAPGRRILVIESGGTAEDPAHEALNAVEMAPDCWSPEEAALRDAYHRSLTRHWDGARQAYGVRCRGLGGSTQAWAGKSAPFDAVDYAVRDWVPGSGWPIGPAELAPYIARAAERLNLGPGPFDDGLWEALGRARPSPEIPGPAFRTLVWKFARSRRSATDIMRFGADFRADPPAGVTVITEATVTAIHATEGGAAVRGLSAQSLGGRRLEVAAPLVILAASAVENARLLLLSRDAAPSGLGNGHDRVGRGLMDHPTATVARVEGPAEAAVLAARLGLVGQRAGGRTHVYMHGLALREDWQRAERALNGAVFATEERAPDDPFAAVGRLLRRRSDAPLRDALAVAKSPVRLTRGAAARILERGRLPAPVTRTVVDLAIRFFPNAVAQEFQSGRLPLKLSGLRLEASSEQPPDPENRVSLSDRRDALGLPMARVRWQAGGAARRNLLRMGTALIAALEDAGLAGVAPVGWVARGAPDDAPVIDLGHSLGTTRMSASPRDGVVDADCRVHGIEGLYIAGGSVLPTSGHANPTLMMLALALRLGDHVDRAAPRR